MKNLSVIVILLLALGATAKAQTFMLGVKAGVSVSQLEGDEASAPFAPTGNNTVTYTPGGTMTGLHIGAFGRVKVPVIGIYIQPELLYSRTGGEIKATFEDASGASFADEQTESIVYNRLDIPVMVGKKFSILRVNAGPIATLNLGDTFDAGDVEANTNDFVFGYQAGIGFDFGKKFIIDLKYEGNLSNFGDGVSVGGQDVDFDTRNSQIILSFGYNFLD